MTRDPKTNTSMGRPVVSLRPAEFPKFPLLPPELRRAVWRQCLPCRVVPVIRSLGSPVGSWGSMLMRNRAAPPLISQVCREARDVAFELGAFHSLPGLFGRSRHRVWLDASTDIPLLAARDENSQALPWLQNVLSKTDLVALLCTPSTSTSDHRDLITLIANLNSVTRVWVIVRTFSIHGTYQEAAASRLFASPRDDPTVVIDMDDAMTLSRFDAMDRRSSTRSCMQLIPVDPMHHQCDQRTTRGQGDADSDTEWKSLDWYYAQLTRLMMEDIFLDLFLEEAPRDDDSVVDPAIYPADAHAKFERYDRSHPWVQEILERIPKLEMKAMVEFCDVDRAVTEKQSHQGDNHPVAMSLTGR